MNLDEPTLSDCGCCEGVTPLTPRLLDNRPGQDRLAYRVGTHGAFKATMLARLAGEFRLRGLSSRQDNDPSVGLIDAWSTTLDVLAFYQERIVNEGFLRTATERRSILELARAIGYELRPGVAASTYLAFTVDNFPGGPTEAVIPIGTKAQSVPGQDEQPQLFETVEEIEAKAIWNAIPARQSIPFVPAQGGNSVHLQGANLNLKPGDALLIIDKAIEGTKWDAKSERWDFRRIVHVSEVADKNGVKIQTRVEWTPASVFTPKVGANVYVFRQRAAAFGYNAPDWRLFSTESKKNYLGHDPTNTEQTEWPNFNIYTPGSQDTIDLDLIYPKILKGHWLVLSQPTYVELFQIQDVEESSRADFGLTGKTTRVKLFGENLDKFKKSVRSIVIYAEPELLTIAPKPYTEPVENDVLWLDVPVPMLAEGRWLAITGEVSGKDADKGKVVSEIRAVKNTVLKEGTTLVTLAKKLNHQYKRSTVTVNANVAAATHGETKIETLGDGDSSQEFQSFLLKFKPLTYLSSTDVGGAQSTLEVRVNNVLWKEASSFYPLGSHDRRYIKRLDNEGNVFVAFGDGKMGARLPSGSQNVTATYRAGQGLEGMVQPGQISLLLTRPLGVSGVLNPTAPSGGDDPEKLEDARRNATLPILALDRIVSLQDYEDFARAFSGVGKAQACLLWDGGQQLIHLTLAASDGGPFSEDSKPFGNLLTAMDLARHPAHRVVANSYREMKFHLAAAVLVDPNYLPTLVLEATRIKLTETFCTLQRKLGQGVSASEILSVLHSVKGVVAANVLPDQLYILGEPPPLPILSVSQRMKDIVAANLLPNPYILDEPPPSLPILRAPPAHWDGNQIIPATLLSLDKDALTLTEMTL
jgi:predicted phage baseplate assembly protein